MLCRLNKAKKPKKSSFEDGKDTGDMGSSLAEWVHIESASSLDLRLFGQRSWGKPSLRMEKRGKTIRVPSRNTATVFIGAGYSMATPLRHGAIFGVGVVVTVVLQGCAIAPRPLFLDWAGRGFYGKVAPCCAMACVRHNGLYPCQASKPFGVYWNLVPCT